MLRGRRIPAPAAKNTLELPLLFDILKAHGQKVLWAAVGWFLDSYRATFFVRDEDLALIKKHLPKAPQYLAKDERGGVLVQPWNLIVPAYLARGREPDESQR